MAPRENRATDHLRKPSPHRPSGRSERLAAAFLLGLALFMPPLLAVASREVAVAGIPLLYLWLFGGWLALIVVLAVVVEISGRSGRAP